MVSFLSVDCVQARPVDFNRSLTRRALDDPDFIVRQAVKLVHQPVDLPLRTA